METIKKKNKTSRAENYLKKTSQIGLLGNQIQQEKKKNSKLEDQTAKNIQLGYRDIQSYKNNTEP